MRLPSWAVAGALIAVLAAPLSHRAFDLIAITLLVPPIVYLGASCRSASGWVAFAERQLGTISYAVYAIHLPIIVLVDRLLITSGLLGKLRIDVVARHPSLVTTPVTFILGIGLAYFLSQAFDRPVRKWLTAVASAHAERSSVIKSAAS